MPRSIVLVVKSLPRFLMAVLLIFQCAVPGHAYAVVTQPTAADIAEFKAVHEAMKDRAPEIKALVNAGKVQRQGYKLLGLKALTVKEKELINEENQGRMVYIEFIAKHSDPPQSFDDVVNVLAQEWGSERRPNPSSGRPEKVGIIEVGGKGIRGLAVDFHEAENNPDCQSDTDDDGEQEQAMKCLLKDAISPLNPSGIEKNAIRDTAIAVEQMLGMVMAKGVDVGDIYIVGSSSVNDAEHKAELKREIEKRVNLPEKMDFVTFDQEARYNFEGMIAMLPAKWRDKRKEQAVILDIGSGNIVGSYQDADGRLVPFSLTRLLGTKKFSDLVESEITRKKPTDDGPTPIVVSNQDWSIMSEKIRDEVLRPEIRALIDRKPGIFSHDRIYLAGGINWALFTLQRPYDTRRFPNISLDNINDLRKRAVGVKQGMSVCLNNQGINDPKVAKQVREDMLKVCDVFSTRNIISGMDIVKVFADELGFKNRAGKVFFFRNSMYAWPLGYLHEKCRQDGKC